MGNKGWRLFALGVLCLAGLFVPSAWLTVDFYNPGMERFINGLRILLFIWPLISLVVAAELFLKFFRAFEIYKGWPRLRDILGMFLFTLILIRININLYWLIIWDSTGDSFDIFLMILPVACALVVGIEVTIRLKSRSKLAGIALLLCTPLTLVGTFLSARSVDFRALTNQRAQEITQAIEGFHQSRGFYPDKLTQLPISQRAMIGEPMILYGQHWCYLGGKDFYRLGYLNRDHWSSPILYGHIVSGVGNVNLDKDICQPEIDAYRAQVPGWDQSLQLFGKPTPTIDTGNGIQ